MTGKTCAGVWVTGTGKDGEPREVYLYHVSDNEWTMAEYESQCVVWQTALNPVIALELLANGTWTGTGVLGPEAFHAAPYLELMKKPRDRGRLRPGLGPRGPARVTGAPAERCRRGGGPKAGYGFDAPALELGALVNGDADARRADPHPARHGQPPRPGRRRDRHRQDQDPAGAGRAAVDAGVPVFAADIKGDLSGHREPGRVEPGAPRAREQHRPGLDRRELAHRVLHARRAGHRHPDPGDRARLRTAAAQQGARPQPDAGVEPRAGLPLRRRRGRAPHHLDDLRDVLKHLISDEGKAELDRAGRAVAGDDRGVILRELVGFADQGADVFFGEPAIDVQAFLRMAPDGVRGMVSLLEVPERAGQARAVLHLPDVAAARAVRRRCPRSATSTSPKLVFFFDEAHLLFAGASKDFLQAVTQTVRLIRSKGVGIFFVTQTPKDVPGDVLAQLGSRVQHQLRAHTPDDARGAEGDRLDLPGVGLRPRRRCCRACRIGEAIVTVMNEKGAPSPVAWTRLRVPQSSMSPTPPELRAAARRRVAAARGLRRRRCIRRSAPRGPGRERAPSGRRPSRAASRQAEREPTMPSECEKPQRGREAAAREKPPAARRARSGERPAGAVAAWPARLIEKLFGVDALSRRKLARSRQRSGRQEADRHPEDRHHPRRDRERSAARPARTRRSTGRPVLEPVRAAGVGAVELADADRLLHEGRRHREGVGDAPSGLRASRTCRACGTGGAPDRVARQQLQSPARATARCRWARRSTPAMALSGTRTIGLKMPRPISSVSVTAVKTVSWRPRVRQAGDRDRQVHDEHETPSCRARREPVQHPEHRDHREHDRHEGRGQQRTARPDPEGGHGHLSSRFLLRLMCRAELVRGAAAWGFGSGAEDGGFEPPRAFTQHAFQACAIGH